MPKPPRQCARTVAKKKAKRRRRRIANALFREELKRTPDSVVPELPNLPYNVLT